MRNILEKVRKRDYDAVKAEAQAIYRAESRGEARDALWRFRRHWRKAYPSLLRQLQKDLPELLSFYSLPRPPWRKLRTTNVIERCFVEVRRRTRPMVCFVNVQSVDRIICSIFHRFNLEWKTRTLQAHPSMRKCSGGCWWLCTNYTKLWNLNYRVTLTHHVLCGAAALLTLLFTIVFMSLAYAKDVAARRIDAWYQEVKNDREFLTVNYAMAYQAAKASGLEQFDPNKHAPPGHPNSQIPLNHQKTRLETTQIYANRSAEHLRLRHPLLSRLIWPEREIPMEILLKDMQDWFAKNPSGWLCSLSRCTNYHLRSNRAK